jgi:hypothetical protein
MSGNFSERPIEKMEIPTLEERLQRMYTLEGIVLKKPNLSAEEEQRLIDSPPTVDIMSMLNDFEEALRRFDIILNSDETERREFNLKLDKKMEEYRERRLRNNSDPTSPGYKDAFYKLMISTHVRHNIDKIELEKVYDEVEKNDDAGGKIDPEIFRNAWLVIKAYAEGREDRLSKRGFASK